MKITKKRYLQGFSLIVVLLGAVRCIFPQVVSNTYIDKLESSVPIVADNNKQDTLSNAKLPNAIESTMQASRFFNADGSIAKHRIYSVPNFGKAFPDENDVQLLSAQHWGVTPVQDREEAEQMKAKLVYVAANPYYYVDKLKSSIPYLIPSAAVLLQDIGKCFFDSLQIKGIPLHKIIVTSVMRSKTDVEKLQGRNGNAKPNSCHLYGTTFDIAYNRYITVQNPNGAVRRHVRNDTLKWVLSEVLNDMRKQGRCHIKYEVHQGCFHITVK